MKILGLITARGGSKRLPKKNIKNFLGKPLIAWSIDVGLKSKSFDRFILSTDDEQIAKIGRDYGIDVPFLRPAEYAKDDSSSFEPIKHAVDWMRKNNNFKTDWVIVLEPPSPGRQPHHINEVINIIKSKKGITSVVGITEVPGHISYLKQLNYVNGSVVRSFDNEMVKNLIHRNQDISKSYYINSAIYAYSVNNFYCEIKPNLWGDNTYGYIMDSKYSMDIDNQEEWDLAEIKMRQLL